MLIRRLLCQLCSHVSCNIFLGASTIGRSVHYVARRKVKAAQCARQTPLLGRRNRCRLAGSGPRVGLSLRLCEPDLHGVPTNPRRLGSADVVRAGLPVDAGAVPYALQTVP